MVGLPADINTVRDSGSQDVDKIVTKNQVGFVIPKQYTYFDDGKLQSDEYLGKIIDFNNAVQAKALKGPLGLPILFACDFEGPILTPIKRGLIPPPSAIALGATQHKQSLFESGSLVGFQLKNIGIHILLGPVLDIYNIKQGNKNGLHDRSFASTPDGVARTASNFMHGAKQTGLMLFAKHYPSHGAVETNPHDLVIPRYEGSNEQRAGELKPYEMNKSMIDGIMTSHIEVNINQNKKIATFSSELLREVTSKDGLSEKIYITDDLSNMGAVRKYMTSNSSAYADIAIQAFDAGHDLLMFAHLSKDDIGQNREKSNRPSNFRVKDFDTVVNKLALHIKSNPTYEAKFRVSLEKIIRLKARVAKQYRLPIDRFLQKGNMETPFHIPHNGQQVIEKTEANLAEALLRYPNSDTPPADKLGIRERIILSTLKKSAMEFNFTKAGNIKILDRPNESKILFIAYEAEINKFKEAFSPHFPKALFIQIPTDKNTDKFRKLEQSISAEFNNTEQIIYTVYDESDADLLTRLRTRHGREFSEKIILLLHTSPAILDSALIEDTRIIGTFTRHPYSINVDIDILLGHEKARGLENLPVNVGDNGKYYSVTNTNWVMPADNVTFEKVFTTRNEVESCMPVVQNRYLTIPASVATYATVAIILVIGTLIFITPPKIVNLYTKNQKTPDTPWWLRLFSSYITTGLFSLIAIYLLFAVLIFPDKTREFIRDRTAVIEDIQMIAAKLGLK